MRHKILPGHTPTEYDACRQIEYRFFKKNPARLVHYSKNPKYFQKLGKLLCGLLQYRPPMVEAMLPQDYQHEMLGGHGFRGLYQGDRQDKQRGKIFMAPFAGIHTFIHELTHHIVFIGKMNAKDAHSNCHGGDFLWVEEMLLDIFKNNIKQ